MAYMSDQTNLFILYNVIFSLAIVLYKGYVWVFLDRTLEGEAVVRFVLHRKLLIG